MKGKKRKGEGLAIFTNPTLSFSWFIIFPLLFPQRDKQINQSISQSVNPFLVFVTFQIVRSSL